MKKAQFQPERSEITINGHRMSWMLKRSKTESAFGIRGSRIFYLELSKDGTLIGKYDHGWDISKRIDKDDEEANLCLSFLIDKYGKDTPKRRKERGFQE